MAASVSEQFHIPTTHLWRHPPAGQPPIPAIASVLHAMLASARARGSHPALVGTTQSLLHAALREPALAIGHAVAAAVPSVAPVASLLPHSPAGDAPGPHHRAARL